MVELFFWILAAALLAIYIGHPIILWILSRLRPCPYTPGDELPKVTMYVSALNEERDIEEKIANFLELEYEGQLDLVIADDGSTDGTSKIVAKYTHLDNVSLNRSDTNIGKTAMQNRVVPELHGDIIIFTDATSKMPRDLVQKTVAPFADAEVGCVSANVRFESVHSGDTSAGQGLYWKYEQLIRTLGSKVWTNIVVSGTCYAIRKELFRRLAPEIAEDLGTPLQIACAGKRVVFIGDVAVTEAANETMHSEWLMRKRVALQNITAIVGLRSLLRTAPTFVKYQFVMHKVGRAIVAPIMVGLIALNILLASEAGYLMILVVQLSFYLLAISGAVSSQLRAACKVCRVASQFLLLNLSYIPSWIGFLRGGRIAAWQTDR